MKTKSLLLILTLLSTTPLFSQIPSYLPTNGLVGYWPFNSNANDESGNGNNGVVSGTPFYINSRNNQSSSALRLSGLNDNVSLNAPDISTLTNSVSFSIWIKKDQPYTYSSLFFLKNGTAYSNGFNVSIDQNDATMGSGNFRLAFAVANSPNINVVIPLTQLQNWNNLTGTYDGSVIKLFLNGNLVSSGNFSGSINPPNSNLLFSDWDNPSPPSTPERDVDDIGIWNRALTQQEITALYQSNNCSVPAYVPTNGLVGYWPFCGNANDVSGNGNNGTVNGATLTTDRNGNANEAYSFDGVDDFIDLGNTSDFGVTINEVKSIGFWTKNCISGNLISKYYNFDAGNSNFLISASNSLLGISGNGTNQFTANFLSQNTWKHVVVIYNGLNGNASVFVNGTAIGVGIPINYANSISTSNTFIGKIDGLFPGFFNGIVDDLGIWNRALTQQEVSALYTSQSCNSHAITADGPTTFCAGNSVNLTSNISGATYQWKKNGVNIATNATSRSYKVTAAGSYTCVATCNGNLVTSNAIQATTKGNTNPMVSALGATTFCAGDSVMLSCNNLGANYSIQWYRTGVSMENATAYTKVVTQPGTYKVVSKNNTNGCSRISSSSVVVAVNCRMSDPNAPSVQAPINDESIKSTEAASSSILYIYPNPAENRFTVEFMGVEQHGTATLEIINGLGQMVTYKDVYVSDGYLREEFEISNESKGGICLVRLVIGDEVYDSKVVLR